MVTESESRVKVTDATVTITDADGTAVNAADLWLIGSATNGITVANAIDIRGLSHLTKALLISSYKVLAPSASITITEYGTISWLDGLIDFGILLLQYLLPTTRLLVQLNDCSSSNRIF